MNLVLMEVEELETVVKANMEQTTEVVLVEAKATTETNQLTTMEEVRLRTMQEKRQWLLIHRCTNHILRLEIWVVVVVNQTGEQILQLLLATLETKLFLKLLANTVMELLLIGAKMLLKITKTNNLLNGIKK